jgi:hypothetical protein
MVLNTSFSTNFFENQKGKKGKRNLCRCPSVSILFVFSLMVLTPEALISLKTKK